MVEDGGVNLSPRHWSALDALLLQEKKQEHERSDGKNGTGHEQTIIRPVQAAEIINHDGEPE